MARRTLLLIAAILVAAVGTGLIWYYVKTADDRARHHEETLEAYVPTRTLDPNTTSDTAVQLAPPTTLQRAGVPADVVTPANVSLLKGKVLVVRVAAGQALLVSMFGTPGSAVTTAGLRQDRLGVEVTLADPNRVAGLLRSGSSITIFTTTGAAGAGGAGAARVLLDKVTVLSVGGAAAQSSSSIPQSLVALDVNQEEAGKIFFAQADKSIALWFALWGGDSVKIDHNAITTPQNLYAPTVTP